jgi:hypothetical protein
LFAVLRIRSRFLISLLSSPWSIAITYSDHFGWNALPCDYEECLGEGIPSDISDHDASIIFIECPKFQTRSFQREVWLYERTDHEHLSSQLFAIFFCCLTNTVSFYNFSSELTIKSWSIAITYSDHFG